MENLKLGALEGISALIVILVLALAAVGILTVIIVSGIKAIKERKDAQEDEEENKFFEEYGVTGDELRLNQKMAEMRLKLASSKKFKKELLDGKHVVVVHEKIKGEPVVIEKTVEVPVEIPVEVPVEKPVEEKAEEVAASAAVQEVEEVVETVEEPVDDRVVADPSEHKLVEKAEKEDDWSNYDGDYEGIYYDPQCACYFEGEPDEETAAKLEAKRYELDGNKHKVVVKKIIPPYAELKTAKNERQTPARVSGFDESLIYGKYIIEHAEKEDGGTEYFFTLYNPFNKVLYRSGNFRTLDYCKKGVTYFKSHVLNGEFAVCGADEKFYYELRRKNYVHVGEFVEGFDEAKSLIDAVKNYAHTDVVREQ